MWARHNLRPLPQLPDRGPRWQPRRPAPDASATPRLEELEALLRGGP